MINEKEPLVNKYITLPKDMDPTLLNCAAYIAGIIEGILYAANFEARVTAQAYLEPQMTVYFIKFKPEVVERDKTISNK